MALRFGFLICCICYPDFVSGAVAADCLDERKVSARQYWLLEAWGNECLLEREIDGIRHRAVRANGNPFLFRNGYCFVSTLDALSSERERVFGYRDAISLMVDPGSETRHDAEYVLKQAERVLGKRFSTIRELREWWWPRQFYSFSPERTKLAIDEEAFQRGEPLLRYVEYTRDDYWRGVVVNRWNEPRVREPSEHRSDLPTYTPIPFHRQGSDWVGELCDRTSYKGMNPCYLVKFDFNEIQNAANKERGLRSGVIEVVKNWQLLPNFGPFENHWESASARLEAYTGQSLTPPEWEQWIERDGLTSLVLSEDGQKLVLKIAEEE